MLKKQRKLKKLLNQHNFKFKKNKIDNSDKKDKSEKNATKGKNVTKNDKFEKNDKICEKR